MGIGFLELVIIGVAALVLLGPERIPEVMRTLAKFYVQLRRTSNEFKGAFDHVVREAESELRHDELQKLRQMIASQSVQIDPVNKISTAQGSENAPSAIPPPRAEARLGWDAPVNSDHPTSKLE